jgi:hypothetical protein
MAKKSKTPRRPPRPQAASARAVVRGARWHQNKRVLLGGVILLLVIGLGVLVRYRQQSQIAPRLQGAIDNHYTRGVVGAPVVIKEFSDYG